MSWNVSSGGGGNFTPAPEGMDQGVLADIVDRGYRVNDFDKEDIKVQRKSSWKYFLSQINEETGEPFTVEDWLTVSMHKNATMRKRVQSITGKKLSDEEANGFDIDGLISTNVQLNIIHNERGENVYANIENVMPVPKNAPRLEIPADFKRVVKDYRGSYLVAPTGPKGRLVPIRKLTDDEANILNAMPDTIRGNLLEALESVCGVTAEDVV